MVRLSTATLCRFNPQRFIDPDSASARAPVAISACLAGQPVRYDGTDKRFTATEVLSGMLELIPICPEVGAGLPVPRPPVQLVSDGTGQRALGRDDPALDVTAALQHYAEQSAQRFLQQPVSLCGYIWKSRSPSCGLASTPLFDTHNQQVDIVSGIHANHFQRRLPWLHCVDENELIDPPSIAAFVLICRVVFDLLHADPAALATTHRHYHFLQRCLSSDTQKLLDRLSRHGATAEYQAALKAACTQLDRAKLLELFGYNDGLT
jgi:uncharacterized protein YbbK (DUF523 family)